LPGGCGWSSGKRRARRLGFVSWLEAWVSRSILWRFVALKRDGHLDYWRRYVSRRERSGHHALPAPRRSRDELNQHGTVARPASAIRVPNPRPLPPLPRRKHFSGPRDPMRTRILPQSTSLANWKRSFEVGNVFMPGTRYPYDSCLPRRCVATKEAPFVRTGSLSEVENLVRSFFSLMVSE
jgi:hypothetical protein